MSGLWSLGSQGKGYNNVIRGSKGCSHSTEYHTQAKLQFFSNYKLHGEGDSRVLEILKAVLTEVWCQPELCNSLECPFLSIGLKMMSRIWYSDF